MLLRRVCGDATCQEWSNCSFRSTKRFAPCVVLTVLQNTQHFVDILLSPFRHLRSCPCQCPYKFNRTDSYGEPGLEMINVTYTGDKLVATKVTGDKNVPRGEVSFTADLTSRSEKQQLPPIKLGDHDAARWGVDELARYPGKGNIAKTGFVDVKAVDGQLLMFGPDHFSFVWVPTQHHVLFGRPSAEIAVRLLRDIISEEDETANMRFRQTAKPIIVMECLY